METLIELGDDAIAHEPEVNLSPSTVRRRSVNEGWDEWWLLDRMWEQTQFDPELHNGLVETLTHRITTGDPRLTNPHAWFPNEIRGPIDSNIQIRNVDPGQLFAVTETPTHVVDLFENSGLKPSTWVTSAAVLKAVESSPLPEVALHGEDLARMVAAVRIPDPIERHLRYWASRSQRAGTERNATADLVNDLRLRTMFWLCQFDDARVGQTRMAKSLKPLLADIRRAAEHHPDHASTLDITTRELLRRKSYLTGFDGASLQCAFPESESDGAAADRPTRAALALVGHLDRQLLASPSADANTKFKYTAYEAVARWLEILKADETLTYDDVALCVSHGLHHLSLRALASPDFSPVVDVLLDSPYMADPSVARLLDPSAVDQPVSDAESVYLFHQFFRRTYDHNTDDFISSRVFPRTTAVIVAAYATGQIREELHGIHLPRPDWARVAASPDEQRPGGLSAGEWDTRLSLVIFGPVRSQDRPEVVAAVLATMIEAPALLPVLFTQDDFGWRIRNRFDDHDCRVAWSLLHSARYRASAPRMQRLLTAATIKKRIKEVLLADRQEREANSVPWPLVNRAASAFGRVRAEQASGKSLTEEQADHLQAAMAPVVQTPFRTIG